MDAREFYIHLGIKDPNNGSISAHSSMPIAIAWGLAMSLLVKEAFGEAVRQTDNNQAVANCASIACLQCSPMLLHPRERGGLGEKKKHPPWMHFPNGTSEAHLTCVVVIEDECAFVCGFTVSLGPCALLPKAARCKRQASSRISFFVCTYGDEFNLFSFGASPRTPARFSFKSIDSPHRRPPGSLSRGPYSRIRISRVGVEQQQQPRKVASLRVA